MDLCCVFRFGDGYLITLYLKEHSGDYSVLAESISSYMMGSVVTVSACCTIFLHIFTSSTSTFMNVYILDVFRFMYVILIGCLIFENMNFG